MQTDHIHTLKAILGPTNTGKTHYAIERMLAHSSGMIGLPLRLLAREVYDKVVAIKGANQAALITGEERIWPEKARYLICTVEAMPVGEPVEFLAIDEVQLAEHADRGHIFTDRLLHARGKSETLLLGSDTIRPILHALDLKVEATPRERFSELKYTGPVKLTKLPKRSAVIAFNSEQVYAIAEVLRRQKGGAAVIMGALSPRTRNAQVELYQSGEVDYLVATDAIGMGLNLDLDHIAFAAVSKFDGRKHRALKPAHMAQIAGRAGRFRQLGTFGETANIPAFDSEMVSRIENNTFQPIEILQWRNSNLDFSSLDALMQSLSRPSGNVILRQHSSALDEWILRRLVLRADIQDQMRNEAAIRRLWDICRLPDFRKAGHEGHYEIIESLCDHLLDPQARLSDQAIENRLKRLSQPVHDIASLQEKLAAIRTWTYVAYRDDWLENPQVWRERTRELEDHLSDALHESLTSRFVDRRTTALLAGLKKDQHFIAEIMPSGEVSVEGHRLGQLKGLVFEPDSNARTLEGKALRGAAQSVLLSILSERLNAICVADDSLFTLTEDMKIVFQDHPIARWQKGKDWPSPIVNLIGSEQIPAAMKEPARARLQNWTENYIQARLPTHKRLLDKSETDPLSAPARGLIYRLLETGVAIDLRQQGASGRIEAEQREALKKLGVRAGRVSAYIPDALKPASQKLIAALRTLFNQAEPYPAAPPGAGSFPFAADWSDAYLQTNGYLRFGKRAIRADLAERLAWDIANRRKQAEKPTFSLPPELASLVSCPASEFQDVLKGFGLIPTERDAETGQPLFWRIPRRSKPAHSANMRRQNKNPDKADPSQPNVKTRPVDPQTSPLNKSRPKKPRNTNSPNAYSPFAALADIWPSPASPPSKKRIKPNHKRAKPSAKPARPAMPSYATKNADMIDQPAPSAHKQKQVAKPGQKSDGDLRKT